ncbi:MAG: ankyrin repeat domain-containing protein [Bryobacterales bacterium]|nr:ankyrin repeat domain-containing protein [Bryobacterales bacterium]MDE0262936.1 ankyrin repeat domain-containing protein [Bryobacterales bacterium]
MRSTSILVASIFLASIQVSGHDLPTAAEVQEGTAWIVSVRGNWSHHHSNRSPDSLVTVLAGGANPNGFDYTPLEDHPVSRATRGTFSYSREAAAAAVSSLRLLLRAGGDPNGGIVPDTGRGNTPLIWAIRNFAPSDLVLEVVGLLLEYGADPNIKDDTGRSAVFWAASWAGQYPRWLTLTNMLIRRGGDPNSAVLAEIDKGATLQDDPDGLIEKRLGKEVVELLRSAVVPPLNTVHVLQEYPELLRLFRQAIRELQDVNRRLEVAGQ